MKSSNKKLYKVIISEEAAFDIEGFAFCYENKSIGLGLRFSNELKTHLEGLKLNPFFSG
ncbi:hypothetical protein SAMN03080617_02102 [Algoriphagus alkaliphilus]|uniref:Uncharacterized protein n=1 Tax=Algoriphagus alkaliphilus TaxID=279824 RepID=A0A1G5Y0V8_9BACT|nr:hypothetical protein [Algoriphagus alkaliphilus]SDA75714.1 hypothetical protein SAMN03080617_02102 [Algoriphagus alkaliphilus]